MIYKLKITCPQCNSTIMDRGGVWVGIEDIPDKPDVPWVKVDWNRKRFDECESGHRFNIRPYADYDEHYIYEDLIMKRMEQIKKDLSDLAVE